jgi:hypothetical protein
MCLLGLRQQHLHPRRRPQGNCLLDPERFHQQSLGLMFLLRQLKRQLFLHRRRPNRLLMPRPLHRHP